MIPDFKTYINESIWSDIQKRSSGESVRKEDEVDLLDGVDLFNYLTKKYKECRKTIYFTKIFIKKMKRKK